MKIEIQRRIVRTEVVVVEVDDLLAAGLDGCMRVADPDRLPLMTGWLNAEEHDSLISGSDADGEHYAVRVRDQDAALAMFDRLAVEFRPNHWRITIRQADPGYVRADGPMRHLTPRRDPGLAAVVLKEGGEWISALQEVGDGSGNSQVSDTKWHSDLAAAKADCVRLYLTTTQRLPE